MFASVTGRQNLTKFCRKSKPAGRNVAETGCPDHFRWNVVVETGCLGGMWEEWGGMRRRSAGKKGFLGPFSMEEEFHDERVSLIEKKGSI